MPISIQRDARHALVRTGTRGRGGLTSTRGTAPLVGRALRQFATPARAAAVARFFKTGQGEYGEGDTFIGVTVGEQRLVVRQFRQLPLDEVDKLLASKIHEERLTALLILVHQFTASSDDSLRRRIFRLYLRRLPQVNNWDLVDASADPIVGGWLAGRDRSLLDKLASSRHLWSRRVAIIATFHYIKQGSARDTLRIAETLFDDPHDLIRKAVGWMLREVGKRVSETTLRTFLERHAATMPRTTLRYAIERFSPAERKRWMSAKPTE